MTVTFPSPTFAPDNLVTNSVSCFGAAPTPLATDDLTVRLRPTGNVTTAGKTATRTTLGPGQSDTYTITGSNQNAGALSGFALLDNLPPALTMVQDGQPNLGGAAPVPQLSWRAAGGGFQALPTAGAGPWTARAPAEADEILAVYRRGASQGPGFQLHGASRHPGQRHRAGRRRASRSPAQPCSTA